MPMNDEDRPKADGVSPAIDSDQLYGAINARIECTIQTVRGELGQVLELQKDAVQRLRAAFTRMQEHVGHQAVVVGRISEGTDPAELSHELARISQLIAQEAVAAVQALQYDDMVSQLLHHVDRRCLLLETVTDGVQREQQALIESVAQDPESYHDGLRSLNAMMLEHQDLLDAVAHRAVEQGTVDEGSIELF